MRKVSSIFVVILVFAFFSVAHAGKDDVLEALGTFIGSDLLGTYTSINAVADLYAYGRYPAEQAKTIALSQQSMIRSKKESLNKLIQTGDFVGGDVEFAYGTIEIYGYLEQQTIYFMRYIDTANQDDANKFQYFRKQAWNKISTLLDIH